MRAAGFSEAEINELREKRYIGIMADGKSNQKQVFPNRAFLPDIDFPQESNAVRTAVKAREQAKQVRAVSTVLASADIRESAEANLEERLQSVSDEIGANAVETYAKAKSNPSAAPTNNPLNESPAARSLPLPARVARDKSQFDPNTRSALL